MSGAYLPRHGLRQAKRGGDAPMNALFMGLAALGLLGIFAVAITYLFLEYDAERRHRQTQASRILSVDPQDTYPVAQRR